MSGVGDALAALKNVILLHERLDGVKANNELLGGDLRALTAKVASLSERVVRIETMIEMTRGGGLPRIEG
ncbi:MAG: hypothetical protein ABR588_02230 [Sphingomicrobium sp.]|nr:hypothetical protein [Sphingomonadales bacterium]